MVQTLGRVGMVMYGIVHVLVAWLAVQVVLGNSGQRTDQKGAVSELAETPAGPLLLWALGIGLVFFALWQFLLAGTGYWYIERGRKRVTRRLGAAGRGITASVIAYASFKYATQGSAGDSTEQQQTLTAKVLAMPGGQLLVGAVAVGVLVIAGAIFRKGVKKSFEEDLDMSKAPGWVEPVGRAGWIGKGVSYGIIGVLVGLAAIYADPEQSGGMDKALHTLAAQPYGAFLLALVAVGLAAFGVYCFVAARALKG